MMQNTLFFYQNKVKVCKLLMDIFYNDTLHKLETVISKSLIESTVYFKIKALTCTANEPTTVNNKV